MILTIIGGCLFAAAFAALELVGILPRSTIAWLACAFFLLLASLVGYSGYVDRQNKRSAEQALRDEDNRA